MKKVKSGSRTKVVFVADESKAPDYPYKNWLAGALGVVLVLGVILGVVVFKRSSEVNEPVNKSIIIDIQDTNQFTSGVETAVDVFTNPITVLDLNTPNKLNLRLNLEPASALMIHYLLVKEHHQCLDNQTQFIELDQAFVVINDQVTFQIHSQHHLMYLCLKVSWGASNQVTNILKLEFDFRHHLQAVFKETVAEREQLLKDLQKLIKAKTCIEFNQILINQTEADLSLKYPNLIQFSSFLEGLRANTKLQVAFKQLQQTLEFQQQIVPFYVQVQGLQTAISKQKNQCQQQFSNFR